jgi:large subunit ribosomal protein L21
MDYSIIKLGNKQHRVRDGETLVVDRVATDEGKTFEPVVLLGDKVTATVVSHGRGPKIVIGKYKRRTGYKRHNGFRAATSEIEITIGSGTARKAAAKAKPAKTDAPKVEAEAVEAAPAEEVAAPVAEAAAPAAGTEGLPEGYDQMTVADIKAAADGWGVEELQAALAYEEAHSARKGAISVLETAIAKDEEGEENGA